MIKLRELHEDDAELMMEWMRDSVIQQAFRKKMSEITLDEARTFCRNAVIPKVLVQGCCLHYAITDESDEYLGTISLKEIDLENGTAEYAVVLRKKAQGSGIATEATKLILKKAFLEFRLHKVYLTVLANNARAISLYEKCGFHCEGTLREHIWDGEKYVDWKLYGIICTEFE